MNIPLLIKLNYNKYTHIDIHLAYNDYYFTIIHTFMMLKYTVYYMHIHAQHKYIPYSWFISCGINLCLGSNPLKLIPINFINVK